MPRIEESGVNSEKIVPFGWTQQIASSAHNVYYIRPFDYWKTDNFDWLIA